MAFKAGWSAAGAASALGIALVIGGSAMASALAVQNVTEDIDVPEISTVTDTSEIEGSEIESPEIEDPDVAGGDEGTEQDGDDDGENSLATVTPATPAIPHGNGEPATPAIPASPALEKSNGKHSQNPKKDSGDDD